MDLAVVTESISWQNPCGFITRSQKGDEPKGRKFLALLQQTSQSEEKCIVIGTLNFYQWCPEAEKVLSKMASNKEEDLRVRSGAVATLMRHCDVNVYSSLAIEVALLHPAGYPRCEAFSSILGQGKRMFALNRQKRQAVLAAGFGILNEIPEDKLKDGYWLAGMLGQLVKVEKEFAPIEGVTEYEAAHGPESYFIDTVKNAQQWWKENHTEPKAGK